MKVFAIGDLHLPGSQDKSMDVFGEKWEGHAERVAQDWDARVGPGDWVLLPGDLSWAMRLPEAEEDLRWLGKRPGFKLLIRGNHDYWWQSYRKVRQVLPENTVAIQNNCHVSADGRVAVAGTRLWVVPGLALRNALDIEPDAAPSAAPERRADEPDNEKLFNREIGRLRLSLESMPDGAGVRIAMLHFPPIGPDFKPTPVTRLLEEHGVDYCVFAHLHNLRQDVAFESEMNGVRYRLVSADYLNFQLAEILALPKD